MAYESQKEGLDIRTWLKVEINFPLSIEFGLTIEVVK